MLSSWAMARMTLLAGAVEFGQQDSVDGHGLGEEAGLGDGVLSDGRVEHEERLLGRPGRSLAADAVDLLQLLHQVSLGLKAAGSVDQHEIHPSRLGRPDPVEGHRSGIGPGLAAHHLHAQPFGPNFELLAGGGAEVSEATIMQVCPRLGAVDQLGQGGCLADAV